MLLQHRKTPTINVTMFAGRVPELMQDVTAPSPVRFATPRLRTKVCSPTTKDFRLSNSGTQRQRPKRPPWNSPAFFLPQVQNSPAKHSTPHTHTHPRHHATPHNITILGLRLRTRSTHQLSVLRPVLQQASRRTVQRMQAGTQHAHHIFL
jgi:hypothetical protein